MREMVSLQTFLGVTEQDCYAADMSAPLRVFLPLQAKVERAEQHIFDLREVRDEWAEAQRGKVTFEDHPHTKDRTYRITDAVPVPDSAALITGDAIHNLRSALDHLAHRLVCIGKGSVGPFPHVYFPIAKTVRAYQAEAGARIRGMTPQAISAINAIEPYGGGAGEVLSQLHALDVIDKHRLLITLGSCNYRHSMAPSLVASIKRNFLGTGLEELTPEQDARAFQMASIESKFPLERGDTLCIVPKAEVSAHMHFPFDIAFGDPPGVRGWSIVETLVAIKQRVWQIVRDFSFEGLLE
jgi:hypothetical protein